MSGARRAPEVLLAKSPRGSSRLTLEQHLLDAEAVAARLFDLDRRWGQSFCRFFKIEEGERPRFLRHVRIAALFHDLGKANADFYAAVTRPGALVQTIRHEHLSALVLALPEVRAWLAENPALDVDVITAAVLSHHLKASASGEWKWAAPRGDQPMPLFLDHPEVARTLACIATVGGLAAPPRLPTGAWSPSPPWSLAWASGTAAARKLGRSLRGHSPARALLLATKAGVIIADSVASGLVREGHDIRDWIDDVAHTSAIGPDDIERAILGPRAEQIRRKKGAFDYHRFQLGAAELGPRALVLAGCGSGKTIAAWKWAEARSRERAIGKVIFLYPTRGTATEGFRDYVSWAPEGDAALLHGTSRYELEAMQPNPDERGERGRHLVDEADARLFALGVWSRRYFSATVDQFLAFMEHGYGALCLLPVLADAAVIIDEVHSFDGHMFADLVAFLEAFDVPVLCMTASLPASRRAALEGAGLEVYPRAEHRADLADLDASEGRPRYRIERVSSARDAYTEAVQAYHRDERVLWVVNRVAMCQRLARRLQTDLGPSVRCYHSRFRLMDRRDAHTATVADFQQRERAAIAVTTQVCEMSLDLDADLLITEIAPPASLVQRFGRANRDPKKRDDESFRARLLTYATDTALPYQREEIRAGEAFLDALGAGDISQRDLAEALARHALAEARPDGDARFLSAGYYATPGALRDADEHASPCVLDADLAAVEQALAAHRPIDGFLINVPRGAVLEVEPRPAFLPRHLGVAPAAQYHPSLGFLTDGGLP